MRFYRLEEARSIPMIQVARRLGLSVNPEGYTDCPAHWNMDSPGTMSCSLNEPDNYFRCPCGHSGWNTDLVTQVRRCDIRDAVIWIGETFGLKPVARPGKTDYVSRSRGLGSAASEEGMEENDPRTDPERDK
jgi:hypothetical protein